MRRVLAARIVAPPAVPAARILRTRLIQLAVVTAVGAGIPPARSAAAQAFPSTERVERAVLAAEDRLNAAWDRGDTVALRRLIAPDYLGTGYRGRMSDRAALLDRIAHNHAGIESARRADATFRESSTLRDRHVHPLGRVALHTAEVIDSILGVRRRDVTVFRATDVFAWRDGRWQLVALHTTCLRGCAPAAGAAPRAASPADTPAVGTATTNDPTHFPSLYERLAVRMAREPDFLQPHRLTAAQRTSVAWLVGAWRCPARVFATATTPARPGRHVDHWRYQLGRNDALYSVNTDTTAVDTLAYRTRVLFFDARAGRWVRPMGAEDGWGALTADAWRGDTITLAGRITVLGSPTDLRQTWRRTSDSTYTIYNEERAPDGAYVPLDEYACVREGP